LRLQTQRGTGLGEEVDRSLKLRPHAGRRRRECLRVDGEELLDRSVELDERLGIDVEVEAAADRGAHLDVERTLGADAAPVIGLVVRRRGKDVQVGIDRWHISSLGRQAALRTHRYRKESSLPPMGLSPGGVAQYLRQLGTRT